MADDKSDDEGADGEREDQDDAETVPKKAPEAEAKPAKKSAPKAASSKPGVKRARKPPPPKKGSLGTSMVLFVIVVGALATGFAILGRETGGTGPSAPKWAVGQTVDVEITLVASDKKDLTCASANEIAERHCGYESEQKAWSKPGDADDKKLLKPYTTTDQVQFLAAGIWSDPGMTGTLPTTRFAVKCKYKVEGKATKPSIRWNSDGPWYPQTNDWYTGSVSGCAITQ